MGGNIETLKVVAKTVQNYQNYQYDCNVHWVKHTLVHSQDELNDNCVNPQFLLQNAK